MDLLQALRKAEAWMDKYDAVTGVSEGQYKGEPVLVVHVTSRELVDELPEEFEGHKVVVEVGGEFHALGGAR